MTRETNMAVGTRNGAGHGHLPLAGDRKTIKTERKRHLRLLATSKSGTLLACATVLGVRSTGGTKRHMRIVMQSAEPFAFAGHWSVWRNPG